MTGADSSQNLSYEQTVAEYTARTQTPENFLRQCMVDGKWNGQVEECDKCGMRNPTIGLYLCDFCDSLYCLICTPRSVYFYVDDMALSFCTKNCRKMCLAEDYSNHAVCKRCHRLQPRSHMQRIDPQLGDVCITCMLPA
jgi:hypothetical protein